MGEVIQDRQVTWRPYASTVICLAGIGIATYLTLAHYSTAVSLSCPGGGGGSIINCGEVTTSPQSVIFGIPVAVLGLAYFVPMLGLCLPWAWRSANKLVAPLRIAGVVTGVGFVGYLLYTELYTIGKICLWCTGVHILTFLLFVVVVTGWEDAITARSPS